MADIKTTTITYKKQPIDFLRVCALNLDGVIRDLTLSKRGGVCLKTLIRVRADLLKVVDKGDASVNMHEVRLAAVNESMDVDNGVHIVRPDDGKEPA
ncbi:MAG: hypothetical protein KAT90_14870 [Gammaproteobacteria bacterium]|nr:hypothetical protein [Gammaproteobacteria bacterium]